MAEFTYALGQVAALEPFLSRERLDPYLKFCAQDRLRAFKLHEANRLLSQAIYGPLQKSELVLRNSLSLQLKVGLRTNTWYELAVFAEPESRQITKAKSYLGDACKTVTPPRMVAALSFGFWVGLLRSSYARTLWNTCLHRAFPANPSLKHKDAHDRFTAILRLRNRVAHHEPLIFRHRNLLQDVDRITEALSWIEPAAAQWSRAWLARKLRQPTKLPADWQPPCRCDQ